MKLKKIISVICLFTCFGIAHAQRNTFIKDTHIKVEAGGTISKTSNVGSESTALFAYRAGLSASMPIYLSNFRVNTGLFLTQKGEKALAGNQRNTINPTYLVLPIDLCYRLVIDDHFAINMAGGPYFGVGVIPSKGSYGVSIPTDFGKNALSNRMDIGIGLNGIVEYDNFSFKAGGEIGITRATAENLGIGTPRNYQIYFTLGYRLFNWD